MATHRTVSFRIPIEKVDELDALAKSMDRDRSYVLNEAVSGYLDYLQRYMAEVDEGIKEADEGKLIDHEVVMQRMQALIRERTRERRRKTT
jgi:predicted transcriptional regulator